MRILYKNPKELGSCLRDMVDVYRDDLMSYEDLSERIKKIISANEERVFKKGGSIEVKIANILGEERVEIIKDIVNN
ncbi:MAG: TIGR04540 family protein [Clostridium sp.]|uniref:TIGR04540 family protein n=1 Tax=Clostridium culturomicium TaxID=1499683 RepID=UPI00059014A8|nr:TIGR04540 family protein [Clostridium culturomicium]MDU4890726.1 TIGR04540 family protein [Clostridium sp.]MDU7082312.1 TIGR04540 family protein [Clostridium sp.]